MSGHTGILLCLLEAAAGTRLLTSAACPLHCCVPDIQYVRHLIFIAIKLSAVSTKLYLLTMVTENDSETIEIKDGDNLFFLKLGVQPHSVTNLKIVFFKHLLFLPLFLYFSLIILILLYLSLLPLSLVTP